MPSKPLCAAIDMEAYLQDPPDACPVDPRRALGSQCSLCVIRGYSLPSLAATHREDEDWEQALHEAITAWKDAPRQRVPCRLQLRPRVSIPCRLPGSLRFVSTKNPVRMYSSEAREQIARYIFSDAQKTR